MIPNCAGKLGISTAFVAVFSIFFALATSGATASTAPLFQPAVTYASGGVNPNSVIVADVNGDGKPDLIVANCDPYGVSGCANGPNLPNGVVSILLGNGDGTFGAPVSYDTGGLGATSVAVADVNGDNRPDLIVANCAVSGNDGCGSGVVSVFLGNGDGTFQGAVSYESGGISANSVKIADVNGDGRPDIVVANFFNTFFNATSGTIGVLLGNGDGTFQRVVTYDSGAVGANSVSVADVNGDHKLDVLVANASCRPNVPQGAGCAGVLLGNGDGTFQRAVIYDSGGGEALSIAVADVNGDGKPDLLVTNWCVFCANTVGVLLGNGDGTFRTAATYSSGAYGLWSIAVADMNGDSKPDLVIVNNCTGLNVCRDAKGVVGVLINDGGGTFRPVVIYRSGGEIAYSVAVADLNGDGRPDIVVANFRSSTVGVLLNNTPFCTTPPTVTVSTTPSFLWPPNGKMVPAVVSGTITDTGCAVTRAAYAVTDEYGEVQPSGPVTLGAGGSYSFTVLLQASRIGTDSDGRLYTVAVRAEDNAGNVASKTSVVTVPHDRGN